VDGKLNFPCLTTSDRENVPSQARILPITLQCDAIIVSLG